MSSINRSWLELFHKTLSSFTDIPQSELVKGIERLKHLHLNKNDYFVRTGDIPDKMAFIVKGIFRVFYIAENGDEKILVFREEGRMLSAFSAFLEKKESWFNIQALEDSDLIYISFIDYKKYLTENQCWQIISSKYVEMIFIEKETRESEFLSDDAETRYKNFIQKYPGIENRIKQYHVASYLGITPVALSRIRKKLFK
jgi:CRP-like cAMP-binding protein